MGLHPIFVLKNGIRALPICLRNQMFNFSSTALRNNEKKDCDKKDEEDVIIECLEGGKGLFVLNRPKQLNTLNASMVTKMRKTLLQWKDDKYLVAIKGSGEKAFCAGGDVVSVTQDKAGEVGKKFFREEYKLDALISTLQIPYAAFISGIVMGGGVGVSLFGRYRIATETSMFAMPETQIGFFPDVGVSYYLSRMPNHLGDFLALTGYRLQGYDLVHAGIATHFCRQEKLKELEHALLRDFCKSCCSTPDETIEEFHQQSLSSFKDCTPPKFTLEDNLGCINKWFSGCTMEDCLRNLTEDQSDFAASSLENLKKMSPLSLKVTFKQMKDAADKDIFDCFNTDYRIATKMMTDGDFTEGVRALLVDKDKKPKWKHADICNVTDEEVQKFFCPLPDDQELKLPDSLYQVCDN